MQHASQAKEKFAVLDQDAVTEFVGIRREIHRHPELGLEEHRTSARVAELLEEFGYSVSTGLAKTGVVGQLVLGEGRSIGLRADLDALPIVEQTGLDYASKNTGVMHACGHDGHTAMLLAAAKHLAERRNFSGTLNLIFQPAEEGLGGARIMMDEGLFKQFPCDAVFGMHNMPGYPQGKMIFRDGGMMASSDKVDIVLSGNGGHGALPQESTDPIVAAASIITALQSIVSRNVDPRDSAVVTVGAIHAGETYNVIPESAKLLLTVRALDPNVRVLLEKRIRELVEAQAVSFGVNAEIQYEKGYPVLVNTTAETQFAFDVAQELLGDSRVERQGKVVTGSEDFAFMLEEVPGSYMLIGNGNDAGGCMVHNPEYDFNDENISVGASYWVRLAETFLNETV